MLKEERVVSQAQSNKRGKSIKKDIYPCEEECAVRNKERFFGRALFTVGNVFVYPQIKEPQPLEVVA